MNKFIMHPDNSMLLISRDANNLVKLLDMFDKAPGNYKNDTLFLFDEVHGAGSGSLVENLAGRISPYRYRLGLSATPEREYDDNGNDFLLTEIGEVIFEFSLQDAIKKGILCEFNYIPLPYELTDAEKQKKKKIIAAFNAKKENGEDVDESELYTQLSLVNKTAVNKIEEFEDFISKQPELLEKSIIFVQTMEYGLLLQPVLMKYTNKVSHLMLGATHKANAALLYFMDSDWASRFGNAMLDETVAEKLYDAHIDYDIVSMDMLENAKEKGGCGKP